MPLICMRFGMWLTCLLILVSTASAATITGGVYDYELNSVDNVILYVNTTPSQTIVSKFGGFQFTIEPGTYTIIVNLTKNDITRTIAQDVVIVDADGDFRRDIFIFEDVDLQDDFNASAIEQVQATENRNRALTFFAILGGSLTALLAIWLFWYRKRGSKEQKNVDASNVIKDNIIAIIKDRKGQASQKYIRSQLPLSESKISMLIKELEQEGTIEKVKKGRTNLLVLKK